VVCSMIIADTRGGNNAIANDAGPRVGKGKLLQLWKWLFFDSLTVRLYVHTSQLLIYKRFVQLTIRALQ
jgi:hypothetical protein